MAEVENRLTVEQAEFAFLETAQELLAMRNLLHDSVRFWSTRRAGMG